MKILTFQNGQDFISSGIGIRINGKDPIEEVEVTKEEYDSMLKDFRLTKNIKKSKIKETI